jgi:hypothetical protein
VVGPRLGVIGGGAVHPVLGEGMQSFIPAVLVAPGGFEGTFMQVLACTGADITPFFNGLDLCVLHIEEALPLRICLLSVLNTSV